MNELSKVVNAQLQQAAENLVRNRLMSDEFLDFVQENTKPLDTLMAYYKCAIMEVETKFKVLNEQFSLEYDRNPIESIKTRVKSLDVYKRQGNHLVSHQKEQEIPNSPHCFFLYNYVGKRAVPSGSTGEAEKELPYYKQFRKIIP